MLKSNMQPLQGNSNRYAFADGLRGLAAWWGVLYHLYHGNHINHLTTFLGEKLTYIFFSIGNLGVPVFFVLSGFVMAITTQNKKFDLSMGWNFFVRRLIRLSPPYYFSIVIAILVMVIKKLILDPGLELPSVESVLAHMLYIQDFLHYPEINVVYWTLCFEIQFYIIFAIALCFAAKIEQRSTKHDFFWILVTLSGLLWLLVPQISNYFSDVINVNRFFLRYWYAFSLGVLIVWGGNKPSPPFRLYVYFYILVILLFGFVHQDLFAQMAAFTAMILMAAQYWSKMNVWLNFKHLQMLGLISYSLYLTHNSVIGVVANIFKKLFTGSLLTECLLLVVSLVACIFFSYLMYWFIEKPSIKMSHSIRQNKETSFRERSIL